MVVQLSVSEVDNTLTENHPHEQAIPDQANYKVTAENRTSM
jgi:hypothetical protein